MSTAIYARVSTETQERNQTVDSQLAELRGYAQAHDLIVIREFVDDGYSGSRLERPALDALRDAVRGGDVDCVLCLCPDRLSRNYIHHALLLEEFGKREVRILFANQQVDDTPESKLLLQIQSSLAEYERTKIVDRCRRGRQHLARQGVMPASQTPYGYDYQRGSRERWQVNESQAEVVREIYRLFVEEEQTIRAVARELTARGIVTKQGNARWAPSTVGAMLGNEAYAGTAYFCKRVSVVPERRRGNCGYHKRERTSERERDRSEWIPVPVPALVAREVWERAQVRLQENKRLASRNNKRHHYLLRGLLRCRVCGRAWVGRPSHGMPYYSCTACSDRAAYTGERCSTRPVRSDRIEPVVWETVKGLLSNPELLVEQYHHQTEREGQQGREAKKRRASLEKDLEKLTIEEMRVVRLYREGKIGTTLLEAQLSEVQAKRDGVAADLKACRGMEQEAEVARNVEEGIWQFCTEVQGGLESATFEEKQKVLRLVIDRVEVEPNGDSGTLYGLIPVPENDVALCPSHQGAREGTRASVVATFSRSPIPAWGACACGVRADGSLRDVTPVRPDPQIGPGSISRPAKGRLAQVNVSGS